MSIRKLVPLFLVVVMLMAGIMPVAAQGDEKVTITWVNLSVWNDGEAARFLDAFHEEYPNIEVVLEGVAYDDLFPTIQVRLGSGTPTPDIISVDGPLISSYAYRGWLMPLDDVFTEEEIADWIPSSLDAAMYNGEMVAAPVSTSTQLLFYNKDVFEEVGLTAPGLDDRLTYEEIAELAPQLTLDRDDDGVTDVWGFTWEQLNRIYQLQPLEESLGGDAIGEDNMTVEGVINSEEWVEAFTFYSDMFNELKVAPQGQNMGQMADMFWNGNLAMLIAGPWQINRGVDDGDAGLIDFDWGVSRHPYFADGEVVTPTGSWHVGVNSYSEHPEEAKIFARWLSTGKGAELWWRYGSGDFPAQQSVLALLESDPAYQEGKIAYWVTAADEATQGPVARPVTVGYLEYEQILADTFMDILNGADVQESLDIAASRITSELAKYE